jgi:hypothetical protein
MDWTVNLPRPAAQANDGNTMQVKADIQIFEAKFPTCHPEGPKWKQIKIPS